MVSKPGLGTGKIIRGTGPVLSRVRLHLIYWGKYWDGKDANKLKTDIATAVTKILQPSGYLSNVAQYTDDHTIDVILNDSPIPINSEPPTPFNDPPDSVAAITSLIAAGSVPHPDPNSDPQHRHQLYMLMLPPGVTPSNPDRGEPAGGEHDSFKYQGTPVYYGWVRSTSVGDPLPRITVALSEELIEAITDPEHFTGWVSSDKEEICDVCEGVNWRVDGVLVRTYYSNAHGDCIPRPPEKA